MSVSGNGKSVSTASAGRARSTRPSRRRSPPRRRPWARASRPTRPSARAPRRYRTAGRRRRKRPWPMPVFDVVAEDPEVEHVADDVHQPAVHEHRREDRRTRRRPPAPGRRRGRSLDLTVGEAHLAEVDQHVQGHERHGHAGPRAGGDDVAKGNHGWLCSLVLRMLRCCPKPRDVDVLDGQGFVFGVSCCHPFKTSTPARSRGASTRGLCALGWRGRAKQHCA